MCRVLLLIGGNDTQRTFFIVRKDSVLYTRPFWENVDQWAECNVKNILSTTPGDVIALLFPDIEPHIATQDTHRVGLADIASMLDRANKMERISPSVFSERDTEIIHDSMALCTAAP